MTGMNKILLFKLGQTDFKILYDPLIKKSKLFLKKYYL